MTATDETATTCDCRYRSRGAHGVACDQQRARTMSARERERAAEAVDLNPERCPVVYAQNRIRCTARADAPHEHYWNSDEQQRWTDEMLQRVSAALTAEDEERRREELRRFARHLLGPLYTAADVEGAIAEHLAEARA